MCAADFSDSHSTYLGANVIKIHCSDCKAVSILFCFTHCLSAGLSFTSKEEEEEEAEWIRTSHEHQEKVERVKGGGKPR